MNSLFLVLTLSVQALAQSMNTPLGATELIQNQSPTLRLAATPTAEVFRVIDNSGQGLRVEYKRGDEKPAEKAKTSTTKARVEEFRPNMRSSFLISYRVTQIKGSKKFWLITIWQDGVSTTGLRLFELSPDVPLKPIFEKQSKGTISYEIKSGRVEVAYVTPQNEMKSEKWALPAK